MTPTFLSQAEIARDRDILAETFAWKVAQLQKRDVILLSSQRSVVTSLKLQIQIPLSNRGS